MFVERLISRGISPLHIFPSPYEHLQTQWWMNRKERGKLDAMNRRRSNNFGSENSLYKLCNCLPYLHSEDWREGGGSRGLEKRNYFDRKWETSRVNVNNMLTTSFYARRSQKCIKTIKVNSRKKSWSTCCAAILQRMCALCCVLKFDEIETFINILRAAFPAKVFYSAFLYFWVCNFLAKGNICKSCS